MRTILIRLAELLALCFTLSPLSCALVYFGFVPSTEAAYGIVLLVATVIFIVTNVTMLRRCYYELRNQKKYYLYNLTAYGIFMLITAVVYKCFGRKAFAWMFNALKVMAYTSLDFDAVRSTAAMHAIMLLVILIAPIGMEWVLKPSDSDQAEEDAEKEEEQREETSEAVEK